MACLENRARSIPFLPRQGAASACKVQDSPRQRSCTLQSASDPFTREGRLDSSAYIVQRVWESRRSSHVGCSFVVTTIGFFAAAWAYAPAASGCDKRSRDANGILIGAVVSLLLALYLVYALLRPQRF